MDLKNDNTLGFRNEIPFINSIKTKLILIFAGSLIITSISLGYYYTQSNNHIVLQQYSQQHLMQERLQSTELFASIGNARRDLQVLRDSPILQNLIRQLAREPNGKISEVWKLRLQQSFISYLRNNPDYMQLRLIGVANGGHEIVRVDQNNGKILVTPRQKLQDKSQRDYYQSITQLSSGNIYTSRIDLNREFGRLSTPYTPTIRLAVPIFHSPEKMYAFLIINVDLTHAFTAIRNQIPKNTRLFIINSKGQYLINPDRSREFAFEFGKQARFQDDFPDLSSKLTNLPDSGLDMEMSINGQDQFVHAYPLGGKHAPENSQMTAIELIPKQALFKDILNTAATGNLFTLILTSISVLIAFLFSHRLISPIRSLSSAAVSAANGNYSGHQFPEGKDEVGVLSKTFHRMVQQIEQRELAIRDSRARYKAIFTGAEDSIVITDSDGNIEEANDAFCSLLGIPRDEIKRFNLFDMLIDNAAETISINRNINTLPSGETQVQTHDGNFIPVTGSVNTFTNTDGEHHAIYLHDLRPRLVAEEDRMNLLLQLRQAHKMESVGLLASGIAHDFNNVLSCVSGYSELLKDSHNITSTEKQRYLDEILGASAKARDMIRNLMRYSRSDQGNLHTDDVQQTILEIISVLEHALTSKIMLSYDIELNDTSMDIAPFQLQQIILNLCINARDAMNGSGAILITAHIDQKDSLQCDSCGTEFGGDFVKLTVKDNGPGIEPEKVTSIFEPFFTTKKSNEGTGLGLYMVHTIIHDAGGHVVVDTREGECCSFTLYLPYKENTPDYLESDQPPLKQMG